MNLGKWTKKYLEDHDVGVLDPTGQEVMIVRAPTLRDALRQLVMDLKGKEIGDAQTGLGQNADRPDEPEGVLSVTLSATFAGLLIKKIQEALGEEIEIEA